MTPNSRLTEKNKQEKLDNTSTQFEDERNHLVNRAAAFWSHFNRFGKDFLVLSLLTIAIVSLLGLFGATEGSIITPYIKILRHWVGLGSYLIVFLLLVISIAILRQPFRKHARLNIGKTISLEAWFFCMLILITIFGGHTLEKAEQGFDGGIVGWGLTEIIQSIIPSPWSIFLLLLLLIFLTLSSFGISQFLRNKFVKWVLASEEIKIPTASEPIQKNVIDFSTPTEQENQPEIDQANEEIEESDFSPERILPSISILTEEETNLLDKEYIHDSASIIETTLAEFGIPARVVGFRAGPTITQFAVEPGFIEKKSVDGTIIQQKVRISQISTLSRDLALALSAERLRIEAPVPGHSFVGIEAPNPKSSIVRLRPLIESKPFKKLSSSLGLALGRDVSGQPVVADLARMPHILIAGTTGSGKSICIQSITTCLAMNNTPDELRMALLDPKMVELVRFNGLPHIFGQVETEIERMIGILQWALKEMDNRYRLFESARTRDLAAYNKKIKKRKEKPLPYIVILIDELADLMMSAPDQTEHSLVRLAQMARATGIHLVVATQRPSTDVVTGLIKANFPSRVSFNVASSVDSRVILDSNGAEDLLGHGDMLFLNPEHGIPIRAQGAMVTESEIEEMINFWQTSPYAEKIMSEDAPWEDLIKKHEDSNDSDNLIDMALEVIQKTRRASTSLLQRRLRIGYPRAARLMDDLEEMGVVGPSLGGGKERDVLIPPLDENDEEI